MDERKQSRYVKLSENQAPLQDTQPGELNQPIQLGFLKCSQCGFETRVGYSIPTDEPWTTGIFGCADDRESCLTGLFCPCVLFGCNVESWSEDTPWISPCICYAISIYGGNTLTAATAMFFGLEPQGAVLIGYGFLLTLFLCGIYAGQVRESLQRKYHLQDSPCGPILVHSCLHWCALHQEHREMRGLVADVTMLMTVVNPPPAPQMMMARKIQKQILLTKTMSIQLWKCSLFRTYHLFIVLRITCLYEILH